MKLTLETNSDNWREVCEKLCTRRSIHGVLDGWQVQAGNAGLDIPIPTDITVPPGKMGFKIHLGVKTQPGHHYWLAPRSSISKTPLRMSNSMGLIDISYRGELVFVVDNMKTLPYVLKKGRRICQIVSMTGSQIYFNFGKVNKTKRGAGGLGSSGLGETVAAPKVDVL